MFQSEGQERNFIGSDKKCVKPRCQTQELLSFLSRKLLVTANILLSPCSISIRDSILAKNVLCEIRFTAQLNIISSNDLKCQENFRTRGFLRHLEELGRKIKMSVIYAMAHLPRAHFCNPFSGAVKNFIGTRYQKRNSLQLFFNFLLISCFYWTSIPSR